MSLGVGARLGHYAVTAKLGEGGTVGLCAEVLLACLILTAAAPASAQLTRTPWGAPDLNGY